MKVNLHIERLVLDGISVELHQRPLLLASFETELGRLLARKGIASGLQNGGAFKAIQTDSIGVGEIKKPSHLGRKIARSVYGGIK